MSRSSSYSTAETRALIEGYAELKEAKSTSGFGLRILCQLADLDRAIKNMPPKEYQVVLLHGLLGHTVRNAEELLGISRHTLLDRYRKGIEFLTDHMNNRDAALQVSR
jgi:DNA-directed RNA polymerase specialized sigma24 family protein